MAILTKQIMEVDENISRQDKVRQKQTDIVRHFSTTLRFIIFSKDKQKH